MHPVIKKVVVPIDFSDASEQAAAYAAALAGQLGASVHFVHAIDPQSKFGAGPSYWQLRERLVALADKFARGLERSAEIRQELPADAIVAAVMDYGADLVVMSTHGRSGLSHLMMGSVAEHVIRSVHCPVLVVRDCAKVHVYKPAEAELVHA
jgi:nucleotide-binding universal stress UspA family protein